MFKWILNKLHYWNWHKKWPLRDILCNLERHDFDLPRIVGNDIVIECFYCEHKRICSSSAKAHNEAINLAFKRMITHRYFLALQLHESEKLHESEMSTEDFENEYSVIYQNFEELKEDVEKHLPKLMNILDQKMFDNEELMTISGASIKQLSTFLRNSGKSSS